MKIKYVNHPLTYSLLFIIFIIFGIILLVLQEIGGAVLSFSFALLYFVLYIIFRKFFFAKMLIDDVGIKLYYKDEITKNMDWYEIKYILAMPNAYGGQIIFSREPILKGKEMLKNRDKIAVNLNSKIAIELYKYKDKIPVKIEDLEKLPKSIQERLT